jgi:hypothetical protein
MVIASRSRDFRVDGEDGGKAISAGGPSIGQERGLHRAGIDADLGKAWWGGAVGEKLRRMVATYS